MQAHLRRSTVRFFRSAHGHAETQRASDGMRKHLRWRACSPPPAHQLCGTGEPINTLVNYSTMNESNASAHRRIRSFVRREGRKTHSQQNTLEHQTPHYVLELECVLDFAVVFGRAAPRVLEIGFSKGETKAAKAMAH